MSSNNGQLLLYLSLLVAVLVFYASLFVPGTENSPGKLDLKSRSGSISSQPSKVASQQLATEKPATQPPQIVLDDEEQKRNAIALANPPQKSKFAYVTLISGIDDKMRYRGYLINTLIMKKALAELGSTADLIAMIGYSQEDTAPFVNDMNLLRQQGVHIFELPRLIDKIYKLGFAEMALLKITPFSFTQYERIQYLDGDVMPTRNMDCFFQLSKNTFTLGAVSPVNSGWFLGIPNQEDYDYLRGRAIWRLGRDWNEVEGWGEKMDPRLTYRGGKSVDKWQFNGCDMDQGLFTHYYVLNKGNVMLIDTDLSKVKTYEKGLKYQEPIESRTNKPWLTADMSKIRKGGDLDKWFTYLDSLHIDINSTNIKDVNLKPLLGFWNSNFPKGGYTGKT